MVEGLNLKYSLMLIPVTMFIYITAISNPIIKLICKGSYCRESMHSVFDEDFGDYDNYTMWRNGDASLQSNGSVTLVKFNHGFVSCDSNCDDCTWQEDPPEICEDYNDTEYQLLLDDLDYLSVHENDYNYTLPSYLVPGCKCRDWCSDCDNDLVSLPGDEDGYHRHAHDYWHQLELRCEVWELELNSTDSEMCKLFRTFKFNMALTLSAFFWLFSVLALMMFLEYTNFHIFYDGKCKCCFISPAVKKTFFTILLILPVTFMLIVWLRLNNGDIEDMLTKYFNLIGAEFEYDWNTRGFHLFWISIGLGILSVIVMLLSGTTQRHLRTIINYRRGVEYEGVDWKPHQS